MRDLNKYGLYLNAFKKTIQAFTDKPKQEANPIIRKLVFYGVKTVITEPKLELIDREKAESDFQFAGVVKDLVAVLTPLEFMAIFPIDKEFEGHRWNMKDYFYTRDYIKTLEPNKPIGETALEFLWEYHNKDVTEFNIAVMMYMSRLRQLEGQPSLAVEWAEMNELKTYSMHTDNKGKEFLLDKETGKTVRTKKKTPRHLRIVKDTG